MHIQSVNITSVLLKKYTDFTNIFCIEKAEILLTHKISDYTIDLNRKKLLYNSLYNLFNIELRVLQKYLNNALIKK